MKKITEQDIIDNLRNLPEQQKRALALEANLRGISIELDLAPALANITNVCMEIGEKMAKNYEVLLGENYKVLKKH